MPDWDWKALRATATILEDSAILAINKPAGLSVMGERHETDIVRLATDSGERLFPVHRIDKVTTGVALLAKDLSVHGDLTRQFNKRTVDKRYLIVSENTGLPAEGMIDLPLAAGRKGTTRIAAPRESIRWDEQENRWWVSPDDHLPNNKNYPSLTLFATVWADSAASLIVAKPVTGRRHQLRVHFAWIGYPVAGDPLFDKTARETGRRTCLHSWRLGIDAGWRRDERIEIEAPVGPAPWWPLADRVPAERWGELLDRARAHRFPDVPNQVLGTGTNSSPVRPRRRGGGIRRVT